MASQLTLKYCRDESDAILLGAISWPDARLPNGDMAGGADYPRPSLWSGTLRECQTSQTVSGRNTQGSRYSQAGLGSGFGRHNHDS